MKIKYFLYLRYLHNPSLGFGFWIWKSCTACDDARAPSRVPSANFLLHCENWIYLCRQLSLSSTVNWISLSDDDRRCSLSSSSSDNGTPLPPPSDLRDVSLDFCFRHSFFGAPPFCMRVWRVCSSWRCLHPAVQLVNVLKIPWRPWSSERLLFGSAAPGLRKLPEPLYE